MPGIITHDTFGRDVYDRLHRLVGGSRDEAEAFLLGSQGPDALFFAPLNPRLHAAFDLGSALHRADPAPFMASFRHAAADLPTPAARTIGRAYVLGLACHYVLDSTLHPFVYSQEHALCDAGVEGLDRSDGHEVHAVIETELDEMVLWVRRGTTIAELSPAKDVLRGRDEMLAVASALYRAVAADLLGRDVPVDAFATSVRQWRLVARLLHSPSGLKRRGLGALESLVRRHSMLAAMSHRARKLEASGFDNREHVPWTDPFSGEESRKGFWDLYDDALAWALSVLPRLDAPGFSVEDARGLFGVRSFLGDFAAPAITTVEPLEGRGRP